MPVNATVLQRGQRFFNGLETDSSTTHTRRDSILASDNVNAAGHIVLEQLVSRLLQRLEEQRKRVEREAR